MPTRNSYAEWLRRVGSQCADLLVCDSRSQVVAVVEVRPPTSRSASAAARRHERMARVLEAAGIPLHVWSEDALPTLEAARDKLLPRAPAVPRHGQKPLVDLQPLTAGAAAVIAERRRRRAGCVAAPASDPFADTDRDWPRTR